MYSVLPQHSWGADRDSLLPKELLLTILKQLKPNRPEERTIV